MKQQIIDFFASYADIIVFTHVISAVTLLGGVIFLYHSLKTLTMIENFDLKKEATLNSINNFFRPAILALVLLIITAGIMAIGLGFRDGDKTLYMIVHIKEAIWTIIIILSHLLFRSSRKSNIQNSVDYEVFVSKIKKYLLYIAILGSIAIFLGIKLRGF